jgi:hypothetical protein
MLKNQKVPNKLSPLDTLTLDPRSSGIRRRLTTITASSYLEASDPTIVEGDQDVESNGGRYKKSPL